MAAGLDDVLRVVAVGDRGDDDDDFDVHVVVVVVVPRDDYDVVGADDGVAAAAAPTVPPHSSAYPSYSVHSPPIRHCYPATASESVATAAVACSAVNGECHHRHRLIRRRPLLRPWTAPETRTGADDKTLRVPFVPAATFVRRSAVAAAMPFAFAAGDGGGAAAPPRKAPQELLDR